MCGIVGYVGERQAYPILIKGLQRLEYRGYDSAGVALINDDGEMRIYKSKGKVKDLEEVAAGHNLSGCIGIAHTRWATHGEPSDVNAHPHVSENHKLAFLSRKSLPTKAIISRARPTPKCLYSLFSI